MENNLTVDALTRLLKSEVAGVQEEPEFTRSSDKTKYATSEDGSPLVKLAVGNVALDYDLWEGLRNPAMVGMYPVGLPEIWEFYANRRKQKVDEAGRTSIFQVPRSYDYAQENFRRAVIVSVMLPFAPGAVHEFVEQVIDNKKGSSHLFARTYEDVNRILDKAITRVAIRLMSDGSDNAVMAMSNDTVKAISTEAVSQTRQGASHGPNKGGNYPQKSIAALMGLGQFGVSRIIFRDELVNGKVQRFSGALRSIIVFNRQELVTDAAGGVIYPSTAWRQYLSRLFDFTDTSPDINKYRFCSYVPQGSNGCTRCIDSCPSGAQPASVPEPNGQYPERTARQTNRFWEGKLQFEAGKCADYRGTMSSLYQEWSCGRCLTVCLDRGIRRKQSAQGHYARMAELAGKP